MLFVNRHHALIGLFSPPKTEGVPRLVVTDVPLSANVVGRLDPGRSDVVVVEVTPGETLALRVCRELHEARPTLPLLTLVCGPGELSTEDRAALAGFGVRGFMDLNDEPEAFARAVVRVAHGRRIMHWESTADSDIAPWDLVGETRQPEPSEAAPALTDRQLAVLGALLAGFTQVEVARAQNLGRSTVGRTVAELKDKLRARNMAELMARATALGYRPSPSTNQIQKTNEPVPLRAERHHSRPERNRSSRQR
jgi:DNA-binding NarL/FixJ family response regulator